MFKKRYIIVLTHNHVQKVIDHSFDVTTMHQIAVSKNGMLQASK